MSIPSEDIIETAAKTLRLGVHRNSGSLAPMNWSEIPQSARDEWMDQARAVLAAVNYAGLVEACDPDSLDAIASELDSFEHSARADSLRVIAKRQRSALSPSPAQ